jgi:ABC-type nitrate/sulfonate/bicarbonate transport system permease component
MTRRHGPLAGWVATATFFALLLVAWTLLTLAGAVPRYLLPAPVDVWEAARGVMAEGYPFGTTLWAHILSTLRLAVFGFVIGAVGAVLLALLVGWNRTAHAVVEPISAFFRGIPALAWIPVAILVLGISDASKLAIIVYGTFWIMLTHCLDGIARVDPVFVRVAQTFGASMPKILRTVVLPAALPALLTGLRVGYALAFGVVLSAEMVGAFTGLGFLIQDARDLVRSDLVIVGMIAIGLVGYLSSKVLFSLERIVLRWRPPLREMAMYEG